MLVPWAQVFPGVGVAHAAVKLLVRLFEAPEMQAGLMHEQVTTELPCS